MRFEDDKIFDNPRKERLQKALSIYLEKSSVSGVSFIIGTKYFVVRTLWTILLIIALIGMTIHLTLLFLQYTSYQKASSTDLQFSTLPLPAVTFCNVNPVRMSQVHRASPELAGLINSFDPERPLNPPASERPPGFKLNSSNDGTTYSSLKDNDNNDGDSFKTDDVGNLFDNFDFDSFLNTDWDESRADGSGGDKSRPGKGGGGGAKPGGSDGTSGNEKKGKDNMGEKGKDQTMSSVRKCHSVFQILYGAESLHTRERMGHQLRHMHIHCDVVGRKCKPGHFKRVSSSAFGNCYTLQYDQFLVSNDGPSSGLDLTLYLQRHEYIKAFTPSTGIQVVVHEPGTIPFPEDEGFSVAAGTHTVVGLKMQDISRLGDPHGDCSDVGHFKEKYGVAYTRQTCQKLCQATQVIENCSCFGVRDITLSKILNVTDDVRPCRSREERSCVSKIQHMDKSSCNCNNPCKEKKYVKTISSRPWPNKEYAKVYVSHVCARQKYDFDLDCRELKQKQGEELRQEFLKLSIYYEDLNYEQLRELPSYKLVQLLCDVGGSIGLWIGLSLLSLCEVIHLVTNLIISACCHGIKSRCKTQKDNEDEERISSEIPLS